MNNQLMGPPTPGPRIRVIGKGLDIFIRVDDELDSEIVTLALRIAERRRYEASRPNEVARDSLVSMARHVANKQRQRLRDAQILLGDMA